MTDFSPRSAARWATRLAFALFAIGVAPAISAAEYRSVGNDPAILYDAPTVRGTRLFVAPRGMPVEVIVAQGDWVRIRDSGGGFSWIEKKALTDKRTLVATAPGGMADVRSAADESSPVVFRAQSGVLLDMTAAPSGGWVAVRHRDGQTGFAKVGDVWGE